VEFFSCCRLLLLGCASEEHQDLRQWMREEAKGMKGKVAAACPEITPFPGGFLRNRDAYAPLCTGQDRDPGGAADKTAPDRSRPKQPLEIFPIEDLKVTGIIMAGPVPYALIQTPAPNKPKHVRVGEYMGRSFGKITAISREGVTVLETVKDAAVHGSSRKRCSWCRKKEDVDEKFPRAAVALAGFWLGLSGIDCGRKLHQAGPGPARRRSSPAQGADGGTAEVDCLATGAWSSRRGW
jgi:type IV pilus assembly protein PilP